MSGQNCLFCKIINREIGAMIVYEDDHAMAFLDVNPRSPGHTMVIPKTHAENIVSLPESEVEALFMAVRKVAGHLGVVLSPDGLTIGINQGGASGQAVPHLHVHIMPRYAGDGGGSIHSVVNNPPKEALEIIHKKVTM